MRSMGLFEGPLQIGNYYRVVDIATARRSIFYIDFPLRSAERLCGKMIYITKKNLKKAGSVTYVSLSDMHELLTYDMFIPISEEEITNEMLLEEMLR